MKNLGFFSRYQEAMNRNPAKGGSTSEQASRDFLDKVKPLVSVKCRLCSGWGHTMDYCGSYQRVRAVQGYDQLVNGWIREATNTGDPPGDQDEEKDMLALKNMPNQIAPGYFEKGGKLKGSAMKGV